MLISAYFFLLPCILRMHMDHHVLKSDKAVNRYFKEASIGYWFSGESDELRCCAGLV